ncbi:hypothetical protein HaLaN_25968 [Haematococcus lacustris]|uniref:Uncharacterized protein n=1 Tax=Haematococcus lacustris TaxID=44745 RepID=A0A6A0A4E2_HAELA|nr:hypothetical protein HaLaN_25968 [Haematococcus lacustris]
MAPCFLVYKMGIGVRCYMFASQNSPSQVNISPYSLFAGHSYAYRVGGSTTVRQSCARNKEYGRVHGLLNMQCKADAELQSLDSAQGAQRPSMLHPPVAQHSANAPLWYRGMCGKGPHWLPVWDQ